jgi:hypothetical protein
MDRSLNIARMKTACAMAPPRVGRPEEREGATRSQHVQRLPYRSFRNRSANADGIA